MSLKLKSGLYIVSTPIGNLSDITLRALDVLIHSDIIFCEDTRVSNKLLAKHGIKAPLKVYNDSSDETQRTYIKELVTNDKIVSLISDAGTPLISDPGYKLVREFKEAGINVDAAPGVCAAITALTLSGLPTDRFIFSGFLPKTKESKIKLFEEFLSIDSTMIFYESANRLLQSLELANKVLGNRQANVARELTKLYQESKSASLSELFDYYTENPAKGEIVLLISGKSNYAVSEDDLKNELKNMLSTGISARSASDIISKKYKNQFSRKEIYKLANSMK